MDEYEGICERLYSLAAIAWNQYDKYLYKTCEHDKEQKRFVVHESMPIIYFGDLEAYLRSKIRIITAALNPSDKEFPCDNKFTRFPMSVESTSKSDYFKHNIPDYIRSLNKYFENDPYTKWFGKKNGGMTFEPILNGLNGSFWTDEISNIALHTDIITPLPTFPTCSGLRKATMTGTRTKVTSELAVVGSALWWQLIQLLKPHVVILAIAKPDFKIIGLPYVKNKQWVTIHRIPENNYDVKMLTHELADGQNTLFISGSTGFETPYGRITAQDRRKIGQSVLEQLKK